MITKRAASPTGTCLRAAVWALLAGLPAGWLWPLAAEAPADRLDDWDDAAQVQSGVYLVGLDLHKIPVYSSGSELVGFRISYTGSVRLGAPSWPQEFRVLFDTGSGQLIVPSSSCVSETCLKHSRYSASSSSSRFVQMDGRPTPAGSTPEQVVINFGQGQVRGEMVRERMCVGRREGPQLGAANATGGPEAAAEPAACVAMNVVVATSLSASPWAVFPFDGIVGLGLPPLSLTPEFGFFPALRAGGRLEQNRFGMFLAESGGGSELALGGVNSQHFGEPLQWTGVAQPEQGHWQVDILGFHIGGTSLDVCRRGGCRGIIDTGTSQLAVPSPHEKGILEKLTVPAGGVNDCRFIESHPPIVIELRSFNLTLQPEDYMRQLPSPAAQLGSGAPVAENQEKLCKPRVVGVNMPATIGANTFILGQPLLHRYYTVYDFDGPQVGFALAIQKGVPRERSGADALRGTSSRPQRPEAEE